MTLGHSFVYRFKQVGLFPCLAIRNLAKQQNHQTGRPHLPRDRTRRSFRYYPTGPVSHALSASVVWGGDRPESASGRQIHPLHNPDGVAAWNGTLRVVIFLTAEVDDEIARDPRLPDVAWSWLTECLESSGAGYTALGGTVTSTSSTRFGDIAGPGRTDDLELRASWTATNEHTGLHLAAFTELLAIAAGLPPEGVAASAAGSSACVSTRLLMVSFRPLRAGPVHNGRQTCCAPMINLSQVRSSPGGSNCPSGVTMTGGQAVDEIQSFREADRRTHQCSVSSRALREGSTNSPSAALP